MNASVPLANLNTVSVREGAFEKNAQTHSDAPLFFVPSLTLMGDWCIFTNRLWIDASLRLHATATLLTSTTCYLELCYSGYSDYSGYSLRTTLLRSRSQPYCPFPSLCLHAKTLYSPHVSLSAVADRLPVCKALERAPNHCLKYRGPLLTGPPCALQAASLCSATTLYPTGRHRPFDAPQPPLPTLISHIPFYGTRCYASASNAGSWYQVPPFK